MHGIPRVPVLPDGHCCFEQSCLHPKQSPLALKVARICNTTDGPLRRHHHPMFVSSFLRLPATTWLLLHRFAVLACYVQFVQLRR